MCLATNVVLGWMELFCRNTKSKPAALCNTAHRQQSVKVENSACLCVYSCVFFFFRVVAAVPLTVMLITTGTVARIHGLTLAIDIRIGRTEGQQMSTRTAAGNHNAGGGRLRGALHVIVVVLIARKSTHRLCQPIENRCWCLLRRCRHRRGLQQRC